MKRFRSMWAPKERRGLRIARWTMYITAAACVLFQLVPPALFPVKKDTWWLRELSLLAFGGAVYAFSNMCAEFRLKFPRYYFYKLLDEKMMKLLNGREPGPRAAMQITIFDPDADINVRAHDLLSMPSGISEQQRVALQAMLAREKKEWRN